MAVTEEFLGGSSVEYDKSLFYNLLTDGKAYMGFARESPIWGFSTLIKLTQRSGSIWPSDVMGESGDGDGDTGKYYDTNSLRILDSGDEPASGTDVFIRRILKSDNTKIIRDSGTTAGTAVTNKLVNTGIDFSAVVPAISVGDTVLNTTDNTTALVTTIGTTSLTLNDDIFIEGESYQVYTVDDTKFITVGTDDIGSLTLDYINEEWARISGFDYDSFTVILDTYTPDLYDYYLFNYEQTNVQTRLKIETVEKMSRSRIQSNVRLMYSTTTNATVPTSDFSNEMIGDLRKNVNVLGEVEITGLNPTFITDGNGYIVDKGLSAATFFLATSDGTVIQDNINYVSLVNTDDELSLVLSYPLVDEAIQNSGRMKISVTRNSDKLGIFNERFSTGQSVSDNSPPPLQLNYIKQGSVHDSLLDVLGLVRIDSSEVSFAKRIDNSETEKKIFGDIDDPESYPVIIVDSADNKDTIMMNENAETTTMFAHTTDQDIARKHYFDLIRINKTVSSSVGTTKIYRQMFICYNPYVSGVEATDANYTNDSTDTIFNSSEHRYNLGTVLYIANKKPVFRNHLSNPESFKIFI